MADDSGRGVAAGGAGVLGARRRLAAVLGRTASRDPVLAGALRVSEALEGGATSLIGVWQRAPLQAIARLHALAAADLADDDRLGRPRADADVGRRLELLADIVTGGTRCPRRCWPPSCTANC